MYKRQDLQLVLLHTVITDKFLQFYDCAAKWNLPFSTVSAVNDTILISSWQIHYIYVVSRYINRNLGWDKFNKFCKYVNYDTDNEDFMGQLPKKKNSLHKFKIWPIAVGPIFISVGRLFSPKTDRDRHRRISSWICRQANQKTKLFRSENAEQLGLNNIAANVSCAAKRC